MNRNQTQKLHHVPEDALFSEGECVPFGITKKTASVDVSCFNPITTRHDNNTNRWSYSTFSHKNSTITPPIIQKYV